jgi:nucleoside 2-deoxyribosyltransferase
MKIAIIGSTAYAKRMQDHADALKAMGHSVRVPALDSHPNLDSYGVCAYNRGMMMWADAVHIIWDGRSTGTIFDMGMAFALRKKVELTYMNPKSFLDFIQQYEEKGPDGKM